MGTVNNLLRNNLGNGGGSNTTMYIIICVCCMCFSYSVAAGLIYWFNRDKSPEKSPFSPHNEHREYWGAS